MTLKNDDIKKIIKQALPGDEASKDDTASVIVQAAILKVGKTRNVDYNREWKTFNFVSGTASYKIGSDILASTADIMNAQYLTYTDNTDPVTLMTIQRYRAITGGLSASGRPTHATIHGASKTLEVYPTPDDTYEAGLYVRMEITSLKDIPELYHGAVVSAGLMIVRAIRDPNVAALLAKEDMADMQADSILAWSGDVIPADRGLGAGSRSRATSYNLRNN